MVFPFKNSRYRITGRHVLIVFLLTGFLIVTYPLFGQLEAVDDFTYQLQDVNLTEMGESAFDLVIMDYSSDGSDEGAYQQSEILALKDSPGGSKIVLAYLSIGEAESYRYYWQDDWEPGNPSWLDEENPDWPENYKVFFWQPAWQNIIFDYLEKIQSAGFDGVYLDLIDAYEYYLYISSVQTALEMVRFVQAIHDTARARNPAFLVFVQNAAELADPYPSYLGAVDGIGQEDLYYGYDADGEATPPGVTDELENNLNIFRDAGKKVLSVNYPFSFSETEPHFDAETMEKIDLAYQRSYANGYIPYCTVRELSYLTINPGHEPTDVISVPAPDQSAHFQLYHNYPNPFNGRTIIPFQVYHEDGSVLFLQIFNIEGELVYSRSLHADRTGQQVVVWDGCNQKGTELPGGQYLVRLESEYNIQTEKIIYCK